MTRYLLDDAYAPVTRCVGFLETGADKAAACFQEMEGENLRRFGQSLSQRVITGDLRDILESLLPLTDCEIRRTVFVDTSAHRWCAYFDNRVTGPDAGTLIPELGSLIGCRGICSLAQPETKINMAREGAAVAMEVYSPDVPEEPERSISVYQQGGSWSFSDSGESYPFEHVERYGERRTENRFTPELLCEYLSHFGIEFLNPDFYGPEAYLVEVEGPMLPKTRSFTLQELREDY